MHNNKFIESASVNHFFNANPSSVDLVKSISEYVRRQNKKFQFVEKVIEQMGYPRWDKAMVFSNSNTSRSASLDTNYVYIPFVRETEDFVNSLLIVKTTATDTAHTWKCD